MSLRSLEVETLLAAVDGIMVPFGFTASAFVILMFDDEGSGVATLGECECAGEA